MACCSEVPISAREKYPSSEKRSGEELGYFPEQFKMTMIS